MERTKWEYRRVTLEPEAIDHRSSAAVLENVLNFDGDLGWELVQMIVHSTFSLAIFKRPVVPTKVL